VWSGCHYESMYGRDAKQNLILLNICVEAAAGVSKWAHRPDSGTVRPW
jgi:hypothetical protein